MVAAVVPLSGCGQSMLNAHEPKGTFSVRVVKADFPSKQAISRPAKLKLEVRNTGTSTVPDLTVSINSFDYRSNYPGLASAQRPIWAVDQGPGAIPKIKVRTENFDSTGDDVTATSNTWTAGAVAPGQSRTFVWDVTPIISGAHTITYTVAAGLNGKAHAESQSGQSVTGHFNVNIASVPYVTHVDPETGGVVPGSVPILP
jgi:hypothetical protein